MALSYRLLGDVIVGKSTTANGRTYTAGPGQIITVPVGDGEVCLVNGWTRISFSAPTTGRPTPGDGQYRARAGMLLWDETLGALVIFDGRAWRDVTTGNIA